MKDFIAARVVNKSGKPRDKGEAGRVVAALKWACDLYNVVIPTSREDILVTMKAVSRWATGTNIKGVEADPAISSFSSPLPIEVLVEELNPLLPCSADRVAQSAELTPSGLSPQEVVALIMVFFAALRPGELKLIDAKDVQLHGCFLRVNVPSGKTGKRAVTNILPQAAVELASEFFPKWCICQTGEVPNAKLSRLDGSAVNRLIKKVAATHENLISRIILSGGVITGKCARSGGASYVARFGGSRDCIKTWFGWSPESNVMASYIKELRHLPIPEAWIPNYAGLGP